MTYSPCWLFQSSQIKADDWLQIKADDRLIYVILVLLYFQVKFILSFWFISCVIDHRMFFNTINFDVLNCNYFSAHGHMLQNSCEFEVMLEGEIWEIYVWYILFSIAKNDCNEGCRFVFVFHLSLIQHILCKIIHISDKFIRNVKSTI